MNKFYIIGCFLLIFSFYAKAQITLQFSPTQSPQLLVNAGKDTTVTKGTTIRLGGSPIASGGGGTYSFSWSPATGLDRIDISNPIATADTTITYTLTVNDLNGCSKTSQITLNVQSPTKSSHWAKEVGLEIYPNPSKGSFIISTEKSLNENFITIEVIDPTGKAIYRNLLDAHTMLNWNIKLPLTAKGFYIIKLKGKWLNYTSKIIVQ
jgi:hypothetical protein